MSYTNSQSPTDFYTCTPSTSFTVPVACWPRHPLLSLWPSTVDGPFSYYCRTDQSRNETHVTELSGINNPMPKTTWQRSAKDTEWWHSWGGRTTWWALPHQQPELHIILQRLRGEIAVLLLTAKVFLVLNKLNIIEIMMLFPLQIHLDQTLLYLPWFQAVSASRVLALLF